MIDVIFVFFFLIMPFFIVKIMNSLGLKLFTVSIPSFLIIAIFVYGYIGIYPLYFGLDEYRYNVGVKDKVIIFQMFAYTCISMFSLIFGFAYAKYALGLKNICLTGPIQVLKKREVYFLFFLFLICILVLIKYLSKLSSVAIFVAFADGISESKVARSAMGNSFSGKYHWYSLFMHSCLNLVTFAFYSNWLLVKKRMSLLIFVLVLLVALFSAVMTTEKAPVAWLFIGLFLTYAITKLKSKLQIKKLLILFSIVFSLLILVYINFMGSKSISEALGHIISRAFAGSIQPAYHYLEYFPYHEDFLLGRSFQNPGGLLPHKPFLITKEVWNWKHPELLSLGIQGSMPTVFWGEAYANFGFLGVLIVPFLIGIILWVISVCVNKLLNNPIKIGLIVWVLLHYKNLSISGFSSYLFDLKMICIIGIIVFLIALSNKFKITYYK